MTHLLLALAVMTMRVDYYHTGNATQEHFSLDRVVVEPLPWPGNPAKPIDTLDRGKYFFEVVDAASGKTVYSRGFASIYGEWETTAEAKSMNRTFSESLRFPGVDKPARVVVKKRDAKNGFRTSGRHRSIRPTSSSSGRERWQRGAGPLIKLHERGDPADKLDLLILGDGYTAAERGEVRARRAAADGRPLLDVAVQGTRARHQRVGLVPASTDSGISRPSEHVYKRTPLGADLRHVRLRTLRADGRESRVSRHRRQRALRRRRDSGEQREVRRRRHLRPLQHGRRRQPVGAVHLRPRVRASPRRAGRRVLHVRRRVSAGGRPRRAVGAERDGAARCRQRSSGGIWSSRARRSRRRGRKSSSSGNRRRGRSAGARFARPTGRKAK